MPTHLEKRTPKVAVNPPSKQIKIADDPESGDKTTIAWHFHRLDDPHPTWGWDLLEAKHWRRVLRHLRSFEGLTWAKLKEQAGGRSRGTNHHSIPTDELAKDARDRLIELRMDDCSMFFSLRLENTLRVYGIRDGRVLQLLWYDKHHGTKGGVCPVTKK